MTKMYVLLALILLAAAPARALDRARRVGLGVELGEQNGVTGQYWLDNWQSVDAGLGASDGDFSFHAGYLAHAFDLFPKLKQGELEGHAGLGLRQREDEFGLRAVAGVSYWIENHPAEIFIDAGPIFRLSPDTGVDYTAVIGVRFYFPAFR